MAIEENDNLCVTEALGLTKREHFAAMALQGCLVNAERNGLSFVNAAEEAVRQADALLVALQQSDKDKS